MIKNLAENCMQLSIYPPPKKMVMTSNRFNADGRRYLKLTSSHSDYFIDAIRRFTQDCPQIIIPTYGAVTDGDTLLTVALSNEITGTEAYQITTSESGILLKARSEVGLFRGLTTVKQILGQVKGDLPHLSIKDAPDFQHRGVMLDISRCKVPTMQTLKDLIESFAALKYNQLQLYTEHTFAFTQHQQVWADASPYSAADIMEIQAFCAARYIELIPNLNCFGHFERWLKHPEYHKYAECPQGFVHPLSGEKIPFGSTLKPNQQSLRLLNELYDEYLPLFDSQLFNIGGDEPWELGQGWSRSRCQKSGSINIYIDFLSKIKTLAEKRGRQVMFWSDILLKQPESLQRLSKDFIALNWGYEGNHPFKRQCQRVAEQGIQFYVCPGTSSWNSLTGRLSNAEKNLSNAARNGIRYNALGYLVTDWGDHGHHQYLPISYPGFALGACQSWNHQGSKSIELADLLNQIYFLEQDNTTAGLLIRLGKTLDLAPSTIRNASIFNSLLFQHMHHQPETSRGLSSAHIIRCIDELVDIRSHLHLIHAKNRDLVAAELRNAIDMAKHGLDRLLYFRNGISKTDLRKNLSNIIRQHQKLWRLRNRSGGLRESSAYLKKVASKWA